ncbi:MAG: UDP-N-acetylglucosamine--N-acetylmuramyl-(pentapeptide) pyrophosphoryl-undecaprenol [Actinomycetota bacterium]
MVYAVVTGGGTSGHVVPAIAILEMLADAGHAVDDLAYVGSRRGVETAMVPALGVRCEFLPISGLQRSFSPRSLARNAALPLRLVRSTHTARRLVREWQPRVVVSVGGYASEPMARAAVAAGVPLVCVSYDFMPGLATRRQAKRAVSCAVAFEGSPLPRAVVTGAPVRRSVRTMDVQAERVRVRSVLGVSDDVVFVTIVGGSLGSAALNGAVGEVVKRIGATGVRAFVHHIVGPRFAGGIDDRPSTVDGVTVQRVASEPDMPGILAASDVVISRAGASTVAEISSVGVASILVPWSGAADDHQTLNARWLSDAGAAVLVDERNDLAALLGSAASTLVAETDRRTAMAGAARAQGERNRGNSLVDVIRNAALR